MRGSSTISGEHPRAQILLILGGVAEGLASRKHDTHELGVGNILRRAHTFNVSESTEWVLMIS